MLRVTGALLTSLLSLTATAAQFDFVPTAPAGRADVKGALNAGDFRRALALWNEGLGSTAYARTADGRALHALILARAGLPLNGLSTLIATTTPSALSPALKNVVTAELNGSTLIHGGLVATKGPWASIIDNGQVSLTIKTKADVARAFNRINQTPKTQTDLRARILWQIATRAPVIGDTAAGLRATELLRASAQTVISADQLALTLGRIRYQRGDLEGAAAAFEEIPKSSNLWTVALEERAWSSLRASDFDRALGHVTTLMSPALDPLVGPESYFLSNLMSLKTCDYPRLFKTSETFKVRHRARLQSLQEIADKGENAGVTEAIAKVDQGGLNVNALGPAITAIPRASLRDRALRIALESRKQLLIEAKLATELKDERLSLASQKLADRRRADALARLRTLARLEVAEYRVILNKLHIIEAEVVERMHLDENLKGKRTELTKVDDAGDKLVFPYNSDEVWLDELDNYHARVKDCPTLKGAGL